MVLEAQGYNVGLWSPDECQRLREIVWQIMDLEGIMDSEDVTQWTEISGRVVTRSPEQCRLRWDRQIRFDEGDGTSHLLWTKSDDRRLLERMQTQCPFARNESEVDWDRLRMDGWRMWSSHALKERWMTMRQTIDEIGDRSFQVIITYCRENIHLVSRHPDFKSVEIIPPEYDEESDDDVEMFEGSGSEEARKRKRVREGEDTDDEIPGKKAKKEEVHETWEWMEALRQANSDAEAALEWVRWQEVEEKKEEWRGQSEAESDADDRGAHSYVSPPPTPS
ncbi:hypothetical protein BDK51DRAFT_31832 [Blyttiomyces helicus]|uniref:Myb-like domain-containing protein n=1 Tax=Blyttiomyces helicus TaxID=388810 RepID=A0A4P9W2E1_9FUNG|nr:hypothetical protein BDK51DRAFT_31832 [Blyttiomyces helicus]|eukprot:RKO86381.1 hypothetical protein BDK51DRAFT_31832 [Blyttiomyces helicus]